MNPVERATGVAPAGNGAPTQAVIAVFAGECSQNEVKSCMKSRFTIAPEN